MSAFTHDNPFNFEGHTIWRNADGSTTQIAADDPARTCSWSKAYDAFIDAENNSWQWTDDKHQAAYKGRFVVLTDPNPSRSDNWGILHTDLDLKSRWCHVAFRKDGTELNRLASDIGDMFRKEILSFLEFAPPPPEVIEEPQGLGARVLTDQGIRFVRTEKGVWINLTNVIAYAWSQFGTTVVEVEDEGVAE